MKAYCTIRENPHYRRDAFVTGLKAAGYKVITGSIGQPDLGDVLVIWNRYVEGERQADRFEAAGGTVLVAENGYLGAGGSNPKWDVADGPQDSHYYALALGGHNGSGEWFAGGPERFAALGVALKPWRTDGEHVLVCPNRPFGSRKMAPPANWEQDVAARLRALTKREIRIRPHPGNKEPARPLAADLENCWAVVIWASSAGVQALIAGIPVLCEAPHWICKAACSIDWDQLSRGVVFSRRATFERMAYAQWTCLEIASGEPFTRLLRRADQGEVAATT